MKDKDMFKKFNAWSIQASILPVLEEDSIAWIYLWDKQAKWMSRIKFADFKEKTEVYKLGGVGGVMGKEKAKPERVNPVLAREAWQRAKGERTKAYSEYIRLHYQATGSLASGCDNRDLQAWLDNNTGGE